MNFLLTLAYDGTNYCGFQVQPNGRSVAATFQDALEAVLSSRPDIKGCSRTDAGVHALGFKLNFHADTRIPAAKLPLALNQHLPPDIRVLAAQTVPEDFHARYAAHTKTYLYRIHNHPKLLIENYIRSIIIIDNTRLNTCSRHCRCCIHVCDKTYRLLILCPFGCRNASVHITILVNMSIRNTYCLKLLDKLIRKYQFLSRAGTCLTVFIRCCFIANIFK